jgi:transcription initiation factor IIE alpha subunit
VQLESIREIKMKYQRISRFDDGINTIIRDLEETNKFNGSITELKSIFMKIEETELIDQSMILTLLETLHAIHSKNLEYDLLTRKTNLLKKYLNQIEEAKEEQKRYITNITEYQVQIDEVFIQLGYCPLCNRKVKDGDTCCRG